VDNKITLTEVFYWYNFRFLCCMWDY